MSLNWACDVADDVKSGLSILPLRQVGRHYATGWKIGMNASATPHLFIHRSRWSSKRNALTETSRLIRDDPNSYETSPSGCQKRGVDPEGVPTTKSLQAVIKALPCLNLQPPAGSCAELRQMTQRSSGGGGHAGKAESFRCLDTKPVVGALLPLNGGRLQVRQRCASRGMQASWGKLPCRQAMALHVGGLTSASPVPEKRPHAKACLHAHTRTLLFAGCSRHNLKKVKESHSTSGFAQPSW